MSWYVAKAWVEALFVDTSNYKSFLGIWRAQRGPGPWSIFLLHDDGAMLELWANPDGKLYGKRIVAMR